MEGRRWGWRPPGGAPSQRLQVVMKDDLPQQECRSQSSSATRVASAPAGTMKMWVTVGAPPTVEARCPSAVKNASSLYPGLKATSTARKVVYSLRTHTSLRNLSNERCSCEEGEHV